MMEKEARTNKAGADLDKRNRNWQKIDTHLADIVQTAEVNSSTKYPSAAVTYGLSQLIKSLTARLDTATVTDMNNITERFRAFVVNPNTLNAPASVDGLGLSMSNGSYHAQFVIGLGSNIVYHRTKYSNWSAWKRLQSLDL